MSNDEPLPHAGLPPRLRRLVAAAVAVFRADWSTVRSTFLAGHGSQPRADFEEVLLQVVLFCGFPRVVTAFEELTKAWPIESPPGGGALPAGEQAPAGRALFAAIYGKNDGPVRAMLRGYHAEFHDFVLEAAYGRILTRPALSPRERELIAVGLLAAMDQQRQFVAHARGALHFGASRQDLREVLVATFGDTPQVDEWLHRVRR
jgi:alkylhydroperoxidase/carboxymuconolactone decarboxylase family protein YurZ